MIEREHLSQVVICKENDTVLEVARILRDTQQRHLVVVNEQSAPLGIISTVDTNNRVLAEEKSAKTTLAKDIMTKSISVVSLEDTYEKAFMLMAQKGLTAIPIVQNQKLIGQLEFSKAFKLKSLKELK